MKGSFLAIIMLSFAALTAMAQATQPCIVRQYNQERAKTALPGVQVTVSNAGSQTSDAKGRLTLTFRTLKPGDRVNLISAKLAGYEVFNKSVVEQWNISRDNTPFPLVMVRSDYMAQRKAQLNQPSADSYKEKYEQAVKELEQLKKDGKLKEQEYNQKLDELESNYQMELSNLDNYIDHFARIDLNEVKEEELLILEMVEQGKIDEAVKAWEKLDISGKLQQEWEDIKALEETEAKVKKEKAKKIKNFESLQVSQEHEIATLKLAGGKANFDKVAKMLKDNALRDTTNIDAVRKYAEFASDQNDFPEAERFFKICLNGCGDDPYQQKVFLHDLGSLNLKCRDYAKAEEYYLKALEICTQLFDENPDAYRVDMSKIQNDLGYLLSVLENFDKAEEYYLQALENRTILFEQDADNNRLYLSITQSNLGLLYANLNDFDKAEEYYLKALENDTELFRQDPDANRVNLAMSQNNIGRLYYYLHEYDKAEEYYLKGVENFELLFRKNPDAYRASLAKVQNHLGVLYNSQNNYTKAEEYFLKALDNDMQLFNSNPNAYRANLTGVQINLGTLYHYQKNYTEAEKYYIATLENYEQLFAQYPDTYRAGLAMIQNNLGVLYADLQYYTKAEEYYLKALENKKQLFAHTPDAYRTDLVMTQDNLGHLYEDLQDYAKAEEYYLMVLENYIELYNKYPEVYRDGLLMTQNDLALFYAHQKDFPKAIKMIDNALSVQPNDTFLYDTKGYILLMKGDEKGAKKIWQKILEIEPEFIQKRGEESKLYKQLKEMGKIED